MQITITSTLTDEQALILATEKWYSPVQVNIVDGTVIPAILETVPNSQTAWEFLKSVYEAMIVEDSTKHFIEYTDRQSVAERTAMEDGIKNSIIASITSSVVE